MRYLVDGYNLMHAVGLAAPDNSPFAAWESARKRFLDWIAETPTFRKSNPLPEIKAVFDAQFAKRDHGTKTHRGIVVTYSYEETADDLIETLLKREPDPVSLVMVSNDHRLQHAAKRAGVKVLSCEAFIDWLSAGPLSPTLSKDPKAVAAEKPMPSPDDTAEFLDAFSKPKKR